MKRISIGACTALWLSTLALCNATFAAPNQIRVVNQTKTTIYIHKGGYASSTKISPGQWKIFHYPFEVTPPNGTKKVNTSLLVATAGGRWMTTPNGLTYLHKPQMIICLDYASKAHRDKTGDRVWIIKKALGQDQHCKIQGYKQPWYKN